VLEAPVPVLRHLAHVVAKDGQHLLDCLLPDHAPQPCLAGVLTRNHDGHVVVKDLDGQVLALLAEDLLDLLLQDLARSVVWVDHVVPDLVGDVGNLTGYFEVRDLLLDYVADDALLVDFCTPRRVHIQVCR
jgi:hypothetical protein